MNPAIVIPIIIAIIAIVVVLSILNEKERKRKIERMVADMGGTVTFTPSPSEEAEALEWAPFIATLPRGSAGVKMLARCKVDGKDVAVVQHRYTTSSGKHTKVHLNTAACMECPASWPSTTLAPETLFDRLGKAFGGEDIQLDDAEFNRAWRVRGDDEDFVVLLLTPEVQRWLTNYGTGCTWQILQGSLMVISQRTIEPESLVNLMRLVPALARELPDLLWEYQ